MNTDANEVPILPNGCGYEGHDFGASYPDSKCFGGRLYDLDNCDDHGNLYEPLDHLVCPQCQHETWIDGFKDQFETDGYLAAEKGLPREYKHKKVRFEQPADEAKIRAWFLAGYDQFKEEELELK